LSGADPGAERKELEELLDADVDVEGSSAARARIVATAAVADGGSPLPIGTAPTLASLLR